MSGAIYDQIATQLASLYGLTLFAMRGQYLALRAPGVEQTPHALKRLNEGLRSSAQTFDQHASEALAGYFDIVTEDVSDALREELRASLGVLQANIRRALATNIVQIMHMARAGRLDFAKLLKSAHGAMGALVQQHMSRIAFTVPDHVDPSRNWDAERYMRFIVRDWAYQSCIAACLEDIRREGDLVQVSYPDPRRDFVFSLSGDTAGYVSLQEIRETTFHPNATATVEAYVPA